VHGSFGPLNADLQDDSGLDVFSVVTVGEGIRVTVSSPSTGRNVGERGRSRTCNLRIKSVAWQPLPVAIVKRLFRRGWAGHLSWRSASACGSEVRFALFFLVPTVPAFGPPLHPTTRKSGARRGPRTTVGYEYGHPLRGFGLGHAWWRDSLS
jgi:hypothetical protein